MDNTPSPSSVFSNDTPDFEKMLERDVDLEDYLKNANPSPTDFIATYNPECIQKTGNFASSDPRYSFESGPNHHVLTREILASVSPKCLRMIEEIEYQDEEDLRNYGRKFKHFIYSSVKSTTKLLATALMDIFGLRLGYQAEYNEALDKKWNKIRILDEAELMQTPYDNFFLLSSVNVFGQAITVAMRKELLRRFNLRPDNSHGEMARFIVMDSGFKEGIDLFDVKYVHIFEPQMTMADQKQIIGRGTRTCGQKGLEFHPTRGWPLFVSIYDSEIPEEVRFGFENATTVYDLYMKALGLDIRLLNLTVDMERMYIEGAVDNELNESVHSFQLPEQLCTYQSLTNGGGALLDGTLLGGGAGVYDDKYSHILSQMPLDRIIDALLNEDAKVKLPESHEGMREYIRENYAEYKWPEVKMENLCLTGGSTFGKEKTFGGGTIGTTFGGARPLQFTPTQDFVRMYMTPKLDRKGIMLIHSTGSGKTCSAIATATSSFEEQGYTILWVTRTTLKADIWKNMFDQVCNESIRTLVRLGVAVPADQKSRMKLLSKAWAIRPMSYKQFSNMVSGKNNIYKDLVKRNGAEDPLRKTLVIIDEAHKLYGDGGLSALEKPDMTAFYESVMRSYEVSGADSVRLLIMTATPITTSPMEFVKLLNLCRERQNKIEDAFETFAPTYLNETGAFSQEGRARFLDEMAGYVSYLNREKDARTFAQPIIQHIRTPILQSPLYREFDTRVVRVLMKTDVDILKAELKATIDDKENTFENIKAESFNNIKYVCEQFADKKACIKSANSAIKDIMGFIKEKRDEHKATVKALRSNIAEFGKTRKNILANMKINIDKYKQKVGGNGTPDDDDYESVYSMDGEAQFPDFSDDYHKYDQSTFNAIKSKCKDPAKRAVFNDYPEVIRMKHENNISTAELKSREAGVKMMTKNLKKGEQEIRKAFKKEKDEVSKEVLKTMLESRIAENKLKLTEAKNERKNVREMINSRISTNEKYSRKLKSTLEKAYKRSLKNREAIRKSEIDELESVASTVENNIRQFVNIADIEHDELRGVVDARVKLFIDEVRDNNAGAERAQMIKEIKQEEVRIAKYSKAILKMVKQDAKTKKKLEKEEALAARKTKKNA